MTMDTYSYPFATSIRGGESKSLRTNNAQIFF